MTLSAFRLPRGLPRLVLAFCLAFSSMAAPAVTGSVVRVKQAPPPQQLAQATPADSSAPKPALSEGEVRGWRQRIGDAIQQKMEPVASVPHDAQVELEISLLPTGVAADVATHRTSGYPALDAAVRRAVTLAQPLPLPADPGGYAQLRRFAVHYEPRSGVRIAEPHPLPDALPPAAAAGVAEPFICRAGNLPAAGAPSCQHSGSHTDLLTCFAQAVKTRTSEVVGACGVDVYPLDARRQNLEGTAHVGVSYDRGGRLTAVNIAESSGQAMLDQRALELVRLSVVPPPPELYATPFAVRIPVVFRMQRSDRPGAVPVQADAATAAKPEPGPAAARAAPAGAKASKGARTKAGAKANTTAKSKATTKSKAGKKKVKKKKRPSTQA